jgi:hypothetical protein
MTATQTDTNNWISSYGIAGTKDVPSGYEFIFDYEYRFSSSMFALKFRPSYMTQSSDGGGVSATYTGMTFFPLLRIYPLENNFMKFFLQGGMGYGNLAGKWKSAQGSIDFSGDEFGAMAGLGADFCFTPTHCLTIEGNVRYLPFARNLISASTMTGPGSSNLTQYQTGKELETVSKDVGTTMSGIQGVLAYHLNF